MKFRIKKIIRLFPILLVIVCIPVHSLSFTETVNKKSLKILKLKQEYKAINKQISLDYDIEIKKIEKEYYLLINKAESDNPAPMAPRDMFETQYEFNRRIADYKKKSHKAERLKKKRIRKINEDFNLRFRTSSVEVDFLTKKLSQLGPVVKKLESLQNEKHSVTGEHIEVILFRPEADQFRFPIHFVLKNNKWTDYWNYKDRTKARQLWKYRSHLKADKLVQFEFSKESVKYRHTGFRVFNTYTGDSKIYTIDKPVVFNEIDAFYRLKNEDLPAAELMVALKNVVHGPVQGMDFIFTSPRTFMMGSPRSEQGRWANEVHHKVILTKGFYMQTTEVTQGQWRAVMGSNPSENSGCGSDCPVENVYWGDVNEFIHKLNQLEKTNKYRLPTEAEWEYACRAGNQELGAHQSDETRLGEYAWFKNNSSGMPHPVATKKPNLWGLFDMHGNVSEWCSDWFGPYPAHPVTDPAGPYSGKFRVARGGNWSFPERSCRAADRNANLPGDKSGVIGFRVVKSP